jgi:pyruvate, orthophosphate dikinase
MNARNLEHAALPPPVLLGCPGQPQATPAPQAIGFKAHNLARMAALGLPVPAAFVIGTAWCGAAQPLQPAHWQAALAALEQHSGLSFGGGWRPLLLSVRSGAAVSMPGMMDTLLNIGLCDATLPGLLRLTGNPRLVWDAYRRLVASWGEVVMGLPAALFAHDLAAVAGDTDERELDFNQLRALTRAHLASLQRAAGQPFPQDPLVQLQGAIAAVFASWHSPRAAEYRRLNGLPDALGTAVTVQRMVFGNAGGRSGAGVGFTRHPSTGEPQPWVDFLFNAQGEDVVSGRRSAVGGPDLVSVAPAVWAALLDAMQRLEAEFRDMQDVEFTVEEGRLYLLQTRSGKRTPQAAARIALDLHQAGVIDRAEALRRTQGLDEAQLALPRLDGADTLLARAASACSGVASGEIVLDEARARARRAAGAAVLLVRQDAETADIAALDVAAGLLTARGARTSHAAVVARQFGKVCLVACEGLQVDLARRQVTLGGHPLAEGTPITLDGNQGRVLAGVCRTVREVPAGLLERLAALRAGG